LYDYITINGAKKLKKRKIIYVYINIYIPYLPPHKAPQAIIRCNMEGIFADFISSYPPMLRVRLMLGDIFSGGGK